MKKPKFAIVGAGNGGQSMAAHLKLMGFDVSIYDIEKEKISALKALGTIKVSGAVTGEAKIDLITGDIGQAIQGRDLIMVVLPSVFQASIAKSMAPYLTDGQTIVLCVGATGGALEIRKVIREAGCQRKLAIAETDNLVYACRSPKAGEAIIFGIKDRINLAALPSSDTTKVLALLNIAFPQYKAVPNVLYTSLNNINAMVHPAPTVLNAARIECKSVFEYYTEGITPRVAAVCEHIDAERLAVAQAFGIKIPSVQDFYRNSYGVDKTNLHEQLIYVKAYEGIKGPTTIETRYIFEDLPTGLVPLSCLGKAIGVKTPTIDSVVELGNILLNKNFWEEGRTLDKLG
ncbi:MAG TPA: NAD/NADP octopine/nopaline dehydrogenase family protein, partial [Negativicutes bacterium]|nr:NAD/NADP octopine/nopaline dehydrogenase family protein [Negativicutes bacterium]